MNARRDRTLAPDAAAHRRLGAIVACLALAYSAGLGASPLKVEVAPTSATLGEPVVIRATVPADAASTAAFRLVWPEGAEPARKRADSKPAGWTTWTLLAEGPGATARNGGISYAWRLAPFETGDLLMPEVVAEYRTPDGRSGLWRDRPSTVTVGLVRSEGDKALRSLRPPVEVPLPAWIWATAGAALALATAAVAFVAYRWLSGAARRPAPPIPPELQALQAIEKLAEQDLPKARKFREFHTRLTDAIRAYIEARCAIPAPDMTTRELRLRLEDEPGPIEAAELSAILGVLEAADEVKFAKGVTTPEACARHLESIRQTIQTVASRIERQEAEARERARQNGNAPAAPAPRAMIAKARP